MRPIEKWTHVVWVLIVFCAATLSYNAQEKKKEEDLRVVVFDTGRVTKNVILQIEGRCEFKLQDFEGKKAEIVREGSKMKFPGRSLSVHFSPKMTTFSLWTGLDERTVSLDLPDGAVLEYRPVKESKRNVEDD